VRRQLREAARRCVEVGARTIELQEGDDDALWTALADIPAPLYDGSLLLRAGAPSTALSHLAGLLERTAMQAGWCPAQLGIAGVGLVYSRWAVSDAEPDTVAATVATLRRELATLGGYAVVEEAPAAIRAVLDVWGEPPEGETLMRSLRAVWDPAGILNPGRYLI
jgi:glycolate oxidase FAD binding subunit